jgi:hypothetical protein
VVLLCLLSLKIAVASLVNGFWFRVHGASSVVESLCGTVSLGTVTYRHMAWARACLGCRELYSTLFLGDLLSAQS